MLVGLGFRDLSLRVQCCGSLSGCAAAAAAAAVLLVPLIP